MSQKRANAVLVAGLLSSAPLLLAPKGCDAVVGIERKPCGGLDGASCPHGSFCDFALAASCGAADQTGLCRPIPEACAEQYDPVCGCDGRTYDNACSAHLAGVSVASQGECGGGACGGLTGAECQADEFCNYPFEAQCGIADAEGTCEARPSGCDDVYLPVCGCDEQTYPNACQANTAGVSVASEGECGGGVGDACGGLTGGGCPSEQFCDFPLDALCGSADAMGVCTPIPTTCTTEDSPVCGCNSATYDNACNARRAGISIAHEGPCP